MLNLASTYAFSCSEIHVIQTIQVKQRMCSRKLRRRDHYMEHQLGMRKSEAATTFAPKTGEAAHDQCLFYEG